MKQQRMGLFLACALAALCIAAFPAAWAQTITGVVSGTVVDASGAAVPGASVTLVSSRTGTHSPATTDASGGFVFPSVEPATYSVIVEVLGRSEEHTSELQSHVNLVCRLLLEKKKKNKTTCRHFKQTRRTRANQT